MSSIPDIWSLCPWVKMMASNWCTCARSICWRKSGPLSITILACGVSIHAEVRRRLSRSSAEVHTVQSHAIIGTPCEVPVPRNVTFTAIYPFGFVWNRQALPRWAALSVVCTISAFRCSAHFHLHSHWAIFLLGH